MEALLKDSQIKENSVPKDKGFQSSSMHCYSVPLKKEISVLQAKMGPERVLYREVLL